MFELTDNHLAASEPLKQALTRVKGVLHVQYLNELTELEHVQTTPTVFYLYMGDAISDKANAGASMQLKQTWLVVLADRLGDEANTGHILTSIIRALAGKKTQGIGPWQRVNTSIKPRYTQGFGFYPLAFTSQFKMRGNHP
ncbi:phage tail terminator protein [Pseudoalteromonas obscura]|uniref:Uncharacterized protein n=1 Tax=Pseudoalteromonas obscura TaxID=3048491 RepID=A0ABT7EUC2_9GAMM|nr:hypothetical protein [Pseudoalteromonas sp. P94(2023)]MDK2598661.1 hypothetical protein [Pseudoalteromonas sp. P94(2023)]